MHCGGPCGAAIAAVREQEEGRVLVFPPGWVQDAQGVWTLSERARRSARQGREADYRRNPGMTFYFAPDGTPVVADRMKTPGYYPTQARCQRCRVVQILDDRRLGLVVDSRVLTPRRSGGRSATVDLARIVQWLNGQGWGPFTEHAEGDPPRGFPHFAEISVVLAFRSMQEIALEGSDKTAARYWGMAPEISQMFRDAYHEQRHGEFMRMWLRIWEEVLDEEAVVNDSGDKIISELDFVRTQLLRMCTVAVSAVL